MTDFHESHGSLRCSDCSVAIDAAAYQRKVARCDACEGRAWSGRLTAQLDSWNRRACAPAARHRTDLPRPPGRRYRDRVGRVLLAAGLRLLET